MKFKDSILWRMLFFVVSIIYFELLFHFVVYKEFDINIVFLLVARLVLGMFFSLLTEFMGHIGNTVISFVILIIVTIYFIVQLMYWYYVKSWYKLKRNIFVRNN